MKTIDNEATFRITYSMTLEEADLIHRMCDGYVSLARELVKISTRFPEPQEVIQKNLFSLANGIYAEIERAKKARAVHDGRLEAIDPETLKWLKEQAAKLKEIEKANAEKSTA